MGATDKFGSVSAVPRDASVAGLPTGAAAGALVAAAALAGVAGAGGGAAGAAAGFATGGLGEFASAGCAIQFSTKQKVGKKQSNTFLM